MTKRELMIHFPITLAVMFAIVIIAFMSTNLSYVDAATNADIEPNEIVRQASAISVNNTYIGLSEAGGDTDSYKFIINSPGYIVFQMSVEYEQYGVWDVKMEDQDENSIWVSDGFGNNGVGDPYSPPVGLSKGTYYLRIQGRNSHDKDYSFSIKYVASDVWEKEINDYIEAATLVPLNTKFYGASKKNYENDYYKYELKTPGVVSVSFNHKYSSDDDWNITLLGKDKTSEFLSNIIDNDELSYSTASIGLPSGIYYLKVNNWTRDGQYNFKINYEKSDYWEKEFNNSIRAATTIKTDTNYYGSLMDYNDDDYYQFKLTKKTPVSISGVYNQHGKYLWIKLIDKDQKTQLQWNSFDSGGVEMGKRIELGPGTYYLNVDGSQGVEYTVSVNTKIDLTPAVISGITSKPYTGKQIYQAPVVVVEGKTLKEGTDYSLSYKNNIEIGTAKVTIEGKGNYTGSITKSFKITKPIVKPSYVRASGPDRFGTSYDIADKFKIELGVTQFSAACIADGYNYPDALAGAYFAASKNAPILVIHSAAPTGTKSLETVTYLKKNVKKGSTIFILGGTGSVPTSVETAIKKAGFNVRRLWGPNRYTSNLAILKEAKVKANTDFIVATGADFGDALSASATGRPVLLVAGNSLTADQKSYLSSIRVKSFTVVGDKSVVSNGIVNDLKQFAPVTRLSGATTYDRSLAIAQKYFSSTVNHINLADGRNFPDALCGGPLAAKKGGPLLLTDGSSVVNKKILNYAKAAKTNKATVYGGPASVSDATVKYILSIK